MTVPNLITLLRLALVPALMACMEWPQARLWALGLFLVASGTDWVDGYLARRLKQTSALGALLDPLVDKVLVTAALLALVAHGLLPSWSVTLVLAREFLITGLRTAAINAGIVLGASMAGKTKTVFQMAAIALLLANFAGWGLPAFAAWGMGVWWLAVALTVYSGLEYLWLTRRIWV